MNRSLATRSSRRRKLVRAACPLFALGLLAAGPSSLRAANYFWDPAATGADPGSGGTGNWNTTSLFWHLAGGAGDVAWPNTLTNTADFAGAAGNVTLTSANINAQGLIFDTAGYLVATGANTLTLGGSGITANPTTGTTTVTGLVTAAATQTWTTAAGGTLAMGATYTSAAATNYNLTLTGAGTVNFTGGTAGTPSVVTGVFTASGGSTVNVSGFLNTTSTTLANTKFIVNGGSTLNWSGTGTQSGIYTGIADGSNGTLNVTAGAFNVSPTTALFIGNNATGLLNITGGTTTIGTNAAVYLGDGFNGGGGTGTGTITISGGQFTTGTTTGNFTLGSAGTNTGAGVVNLNGGTLSTNRILSKGASANGAATVNFNGGTLQATGTALAIPTSITTNIADNGGTIDPQTFALTIATNFTHGGVAATDGGLKIASSAGVPGAVTLSGIMSQTGGLTINSAAVLSGNNTYTGPTTISAAIDGSTNGTILGATGAGNDTTFNTGGSLRFRDSSNRTVPEAFTFSGGTFQAYNDPGTTTLSGAITLNANTVLSVSPQAQVSTTLVLSGGIADGAVTGNNLTLVRLGAAAAASSDVVNITGAGTYGGATAITDALNTNTGSFSVRLSNGNNRLPTGTILTLGGATGGGVAAGSGRLILGDTANGASNQTLAGLLTSGTGTNNAVVGGAAAVSTLTINNAGANAFGGVLGGVATNANNLALTKTGAGLLTLTAANPYTGATTVSGGTLAVSGNINGSPTINVTAGALTLSNTAATVLGDTATLSLVSGTTLNLNANGGTSETIGMLVLNGNPQPVATYNLAQLQALDPTITFTSPNGETLTVTAVPEPSAWATTVAGIGGLLAFAVRRQRRARH